MGLLSMNKYVSACASRGTEDLRLFRSWVQFRETHLQNSNLPARVRSCEPETQPQLGNQCDSGTTHQKQRDQIRKFASETSSNQKLRTTISTRRKVRITPYCSDGTARLHVCSVCVCVCNHVNHVRATCYMRIPCQPTKPPERGRRPKQNMWGEHLATRASMPAA